MLKISFSENNIEEKKYIIRIIFDEFLGIEYEILNEFSQNNYILTFENGNKLIISDSFFDKHHNELSYLSIDNLPRNVVFTRNDFIKENDIPILYGDGKILLNESKGSKILICNIDIFASSFFMLTRWEEFVNKARNLHGNFPAYESIAYKYNFLGRPIVNEYVEMLWQMMKVLGCKQKRRKNNFKYVLTHDVDNVLKFPKLKSGIKNIYRNLFYKKNFKFVAEDIYQKITVHLNLQNDPYDTFDYLMDISEKLNVKSHFFFMAKGNTKFDNWYSSESEFVLNLVEKIKKRNHVIGIHSTYNSYNDSRQFRQEKLELEKIFKLNISCGRGHYLRFEIPTTWQIWEDNHMVWDSTAGYSEKEGFRCGTCYEYSVFNILTRKKLNLREKPLMVMEGSLVKYQKNTTAEQMEEKIKKIIDAVKRYNGDFVFLWHNSSFNTNQWKEFQDIYEKVLL